MKILLTGSRGYIGTVMAPFLVRAGHEVVGVDTDLYRRSSFGEWQESIQTRSRRTSARCEAQRPARLRRGHPPRRALQRSAGRSQPRADLRHQPPRLGAAGRAGQGGGRPRVSPSPPPAATTARPATRRWTRNRSSIRSPPTANPRCGWSATSRQLADDSFSPHLPALRHGLRRLAAAALRHRAQQPGRLGLHLGQGDAQERRQPLAAHRPHRGHQPRLPRGARRAARARSTRRPSTSAATTRTTASATSPQIVKETVPGCEIEFADDAGPDKRNYRADFSKIARVLPGFQPQWDARKGAAPAVRSLQGHRPGALRLRGPPLPAHRSDQALMGRRRAGDGSPLAVRAARRLSAQEPTRKGNVIFTETKLKGAFIIDIERREDDRGFFARAFCQNEFADHGLKPVIAQANIAFNKRKGTLRGMHFQYPPAGRDQAGARHPRRDPRHHRRPAAGEPDLSPARRGRADAPTTTARSTCRSGSRTATRRWRTTPRPATRWASSTRPASEGGLSLRRSAARAGVAAAGQR